jgi:hypothetical protein
MRDELLERELNTRALIVRGHDDGYRFEFHAILSSLDAPHLYRWERHIGDSLNHNFLSRESVSSSHARVGSELPNFSALRRLNPLAGESSAGPAPDLSEK